MLTARQQKICDKYSAVDETGHVRCNRCPLALDHRAHLCKAFMHYDRHQKEWVFDDETK